MIKYVSKNKIINGRGISSLNTNMIDPKDLIDFSNQLALIDCDNVELGEIKQLSISGDILSESRIKVFFDSDNDVTIITPPKGVSFNVTGEIVPKWILNNSKYIYLVSNNTLLIYDFTGNQVKSIDSNELFGDYEEVTNKIIYNIILINEKIYLIGKDGDINNNIVFISNLYNLLIQNKVGILPNKSMKSFIGGSTVGIIPGEKEDYIAIITGCDYNSTLSIYSIDGDIIKQLNISFENPSIIKSDKNHIVVSDNNGLIIININDFSYKILSNEAEGYSFGSNLIVYKNISVISAGDINKELSRSYTGEYGKVYIIDNNTGAIIKDIPNIEDFIDFGKYISLNNKILSIYSYDDTDGTINTYSYSLLSFSGTNLDDSILKYVQKSTKIVQSLPSPSLNLLEQAVYSIDDSTEFVCVSNSLNPESDDDCFWLQR